MDDEQLPAGDFSSWLRGMQAALDGGADAEVPCGTCAACCTSSQFVHVAPDETDTLSHVPAELLFPAPRLPPGHVVLGYDERGHCPMLVEGRCSIYEHRPRACRTYDCRVFPATGLAVDEVKVSIARRVRQWRFAYPSADDRTEQEAVRAAAAFLLNHPEVVPGGRATQLAAMAIAAHGAFLRRDDQSGELMVVDPDPEVVRSILG